MQNVRLWMDWSVRGVVVSAGGVAAVLCFGWWWRRRRHANVLLGVPPVQLTDLQQQAFHAVQAQAAVQSARAKRVQELGFTPEQLAQCLAFVKERLALIIHIPVFEALESLVKDTRYRSQFETGTSRGALNRSWRVEWENRMFSRHYARATDAERVKYGTVALDRQSPPVQGNPCYCGQYGSSYLVLCNETVRSRTSLCHLDSANCTAEQMGTLAHCAHVLANLQHQHCTG